MFSETFEIAHARKAGAAGGVGLASQVAAITSIGELGATYPILRQAALQGLKSLNEQLKTIPANQARALSPMEDFIQSAINTINTKQAG